MTFFIAMFVFFMMFIFKYIDDFVGKGLGSALLFKLFFYFSLTTIPMALPLAVLLSSLMTFGNLGEHFELTAMKSSGLSLQKIMAPLIISTAFLACGAFCFSSIILPYTNLKVGSLIYAIRESKPGLLFKDGVFNNSIDGFTIRIGGKDKDGTLRDILIYDQREMHGNNTVLTAKSGMMDQTGENNFLVLTLNNGESYKEILNHEKDNRTHPMIRDKFETRVIRFDLTDFRLSLTNEDMFKNNGQMLNIHQLNSALDSLSLKKELRKEEVLQELNHRYYSRSNEFNDQKRTIAGNNSFRTYFNSISKIERLKIIDQATLFARSAKNYSESIAHDYEAEKQTAVRYKIEWHRKFTLAAACIILFFIGAPLGAIIRKGGLGMPVVVSVFFFLVFHILSIIGEKLAKEGKMPPYKGMWMASFILLSLGIFLTYKSTRDSALLDVDSYVNKIKSLFTKKKKEIGR